jgi:hypothetical protein
LKQEITDEVLGTSPDQKNIAFHLDADSFVGVEGAEFVVVQFSD